jgi:hypothetical protein
MTKFGRRSPFDDAMRAATLIFPPDPSAVSGIVTPSDAAFLVVSATSTLTAERVLSAGDGLALADGGANGTATLTVDIASLTATSTPATNDWLMLEVNAGGTLRKVENSNVGITDHGNLDGLADDDHTQYAQIAAAETISGTWTYSTHLYLDDGAGDSPRLHFYGGSNDDFVQLFLADSATANGSDFHLRLCDSGGESKFVILDQAENSVAELDSDGNLQLDGDITLASGNWIGLGETAGRMVFSSSTSPHTVTIYGANLQMSDSTSAKLTIRRSGDVGNTEADIYAEAQIGIAAESHAHIFIDADNSGTDGYFSVRKNAESVTAATELIRIDEAGDVTLATDGAFIGLSATGTRLEFLNTGDALDLYSSMVLRLYSDTGTTLKGSWDGSSGLMLINETANNNMTIGITINGAANTDEMFSLKGSGIAHGMTNWAETDTFGFMTVDTANAGGLYMLGFTEDTRAIRLSGLGTTDNTTKATTASGYVELRAYTASGSGATTPGANANLVVIRSGANTRFAFDQEGEMHSDDVIGAGNDWDDWDDLALVTDLSRLPRAKWNEMMKYQAEDFERAGLITLFDASDGRHAMMRHKAMLQFYACCFREVGQILTWQDKALRALGADPALLEGEDGGAD